MNGYDQARLVEAEGIRHLSPFIEETATGIVWTAKGTLSRYLQETCGDFIINDRHRTMWTVELKVERAHTGNLFLETWSNRNLDFRANHAQHGSKPGWMQSQRADFLFYYFIDTDDLYIIRLFNLQQWAFGTANSPAHIYDYPERPQSRYSQRNDTLGRVVPLDVIREAVGYRHVNPRQIPLFAENAA